ncbi:MAG: helix-turn-helix transcriptional regulator [Chloroflexota bacterium]|nr:helix-turn-helix transcriptional regulator [Chloroflexota bacterium]
MPGVVAEKKLPLADMIDAELHRRRRSRRWLAREIGVASQTINNVVNGSRPDVSTLCKLSQFLGEPMGLLMQLARLAPGIDLGPDQFVAPHANDWPTLQVLRLVGNLPYPSRKRLLQMIELWVEDRCSTKAAMPERPGAEALTGRAPS